MKVIKFAYNKINEGIKDYELLVMNEGAEYVAGIALNYLTEQQKEDVLAFQKEYEEKLGPFMTAYRQFKQKQIING